MIRHISAILQLVLNGRPAELHAWIRELFAEHRDRELRAMQQQCAYILACVVYECFRVSAINEKKAAEALAGCGDLMDTPSHAALQQLFASMLVDVSNAGTDASRANHDVLDTVNNMLHKNCAEVSLQEAADLLGVSATSFSISFKKKTGGNFKDYVRAEKMSIAQHMLADTDDSVKSISKRLGYFDADYFTRVFKATFGVTPTTYRRSFHG